MADNIIVKDANNVNETVRTTETGGVHIPHHIPTVAGSPVATGNPLPVSGPLTDAQLRAAAVPISGTVTASGPLTDAQLRASAVTISGTVTANFGTIAGVATETTLSALNTKIPATALSGRLRTETLGAIGAARQLAATAVSTNTALTSSTRRISIHARGGDIRYSIGSSSQTASSTSHFIASGERLDIAVPATPNIAVIRTTVDCVLELSELLEPV